MPLSKQAIGLLALQAMRVVDGDATPDTNDTAVIEQAYDNIYAMLNQRHLVSWAINGLVPDELVDPVVSLVAASRITLFTVPIDVVQSITIQASSAVETITEMVSLDYVPTSVQADYY